jgi:short-subunit dehydrogenase
VLPGFVRTKMTQNLDLPEKLVSRADVVAYDIYKAHLKGRDIVYTRYFWRLIMLLIKVIPEKIFKRLRL